MRNGNVEKRDLKAINDVAELLNILKLGMAVKSLSVESRADGSYRAEIRIDDYVTYDFRYDADGGCYGTYYGKREKDA